MNISIRSMLIGIFLLLCSGCMAVKHIPTPVNKSQYPFQPLPAVDLISYGGTIANYDKITGGLREAGIFQQITNNGSISDIDLETTYYTHGADNKGAALLGILLSGSTLYIIPSFYDATKSIEFSLRVNGNVVRTYQYKTITTVVNWIFAPIFASSENWSDRFNEEEIVENFVELLINDIKNDQSLKQDIETEINQYQ